MFKKYIIITLLFCIFISFNACDDLTSSQSTENTIEITDAYDRTIIVPTATERYVCVGTGSLRLYTYIGDVSKIIGIEEIESSWGSYGRPYNLLYENIDDIPVIGTGGLNTQPNVEAILSVNPDVIFISDYYDIGVVEQLQVDTATPCIVVTYNDVAGNIFNEELYQSLKNIGYVTNHLDRANELIDYMTSISEDLNSRTSDIEDKASVYIGGLSYKGKRGIESTSGEYVLFDILNLQNVVYESNILEHAIIDKESIIVWDSDYIIFDANGYALLCDDMLSNPDYYNQLTAFNNGNVFLQMPFNYYSTNLEVALANGYYIGKMIYPQSFSDIDVIEKYNEISQMFLGIDTYQELATDFYGGYQEIELIE